MRRPRTHPPQTRVPKGVEGITEAAPTKRVYVSGIHGAVNTRVVGLFSREKRTVRVPIGTGTGREEGIGLGLEGVERVRIRMRRSEERLLLVRAAPLGVLSLSVPALLVGVASDVVGTPILGTTNRIP